MQNKSFLKSNYTKVFTLSLFTAFLIFLPFLIKDHGLFLYYGDYDVQQIPFYKTAHDAILKGELGWNWNTDLGVNFIGSYSFYLLGSPFFLITLLFPNAALPYLMAPLLMLKFAFTGVTGYAFINRFTKRGETAIIGGLLYAFCGFNIYNIFFNHFNEVVLFFPLLLIALEELVINNRRGGFALVVALCCVVNYYFFFGEVIFVLLYLVFRSRSKDFSLTVKKFFIIAFESVIGLLLSAFILLPSVIAISSNSRLSETLLGFDMIVYHNVQRYGLILSSFFFPPDVPARPNFFPDSNAKWSSVSMFLPLFSMTGVFAFFFGVKKHWAKRLLIACFIIAFIPILNASFSAFNYSYYARWFYMPILIMAMVTCVAIEKYAKHFKKSISFTAIIVAAFMSIGIIPKKINGKLTFFKLVEYADRFWAYIAVAVVGLLLTIMLISLTTKYKYFVKVSVASLITITILYSTLMLYYGKQSGEGYDVVALKAINGNKNIELNDDEFFRIDTYDELDNLGMHWKMPTINAFHSIVPAGVTEYYESIGQERGVGSRPTPNAIGIRALTSVKYSFTAVDSVNKNDLLGFEYFATQNGYEVYKNNYFIPIGFTYDRFITKPQFNEYTNSYKDQVLVKALLLETNDYIKYKDYMPLIEDADVYEQGLSDESYFEECKKRAEKTVENFSYNGKGFSGNINCDKKELVFFSVPYEQGFTATVNGKPVPILKANIGFMAIPVGEGENNIVFKYKTPGFYKGIIISLISA